MKARIIAIGDEILIGQTLDTNSNFLATKLTQLGFSVVSIQAIADSKNAIVTALNTNNSVELTVLTGGLGPTKDDKTKNVLAQYFGTTLAFNETVYQDVCSFIESLNGKMNPLNRDQALFPVGARLIRNQQGTAPGMWFEKDGKVTISMPGVPFEMKAIFTNQAIPKLKSHFQLPDLYYQNIMISGIVESPLALKIKAWEEDLPQSVTLAYLPSPGIIKLRLGVKNKPISAAKKIIDPLVAKLKTYISDYIFSESGEKLEVVLSNLLIYNNLTIATAESCTGGKIANLLTSIAGSSAYFKGSVVAYANEIKSQILGVSNADIQNYGAVSKAVVEQMAIGVKNKFNTDFAVATSGIAGPDGGTTEKPVGTVWIAVATPTGITSAIYRFGKRRDINILRSSMTALNFVRKEIIKYSNQAS